MDKYDIKYSPKAIKDLIVIKNYIIVNSYSVVTAEKFIESLITIINSLNTMPRRYPKFKSERIIDEDIRICPIKNYIIIYNINDNFNSIEILRVIHTSRNLDYIKLF